MKARSSEPRELASFQLEGLPETNRKLQQLGGKIEKKIIMKAMRAGAAPLVKGIKKFSPRRTGLFRRSLQAKLRWYSRSRVALAVIGQQKDVGQLHVRKIRKGRGGISGRGKVVPIHFIEEGTGPHRIPNDNSKMGNIPMVFRLPSGRRIVVDHVDHPGSRAQHVVRRTADQYGLEAAEQFALKFEIEVDREIEAVKSV